MQKNKQIRPEKERIREQENLRWKNAGQEEVDELWKESAIEMENAILNKRNIERKGNKAFIGRGGRPDW